MIEIAIYINALISSLIVGIKTKTYRNYTSIFNVWWSLLVFLSSRGYFDLFVPSDRVYLTIFIGMFGFNIASIIFERAVTLDISSPQKDIINTLKSKFVIIMQIIVFVIIIPYFMNSVQIILTRGLPELRTLVYDNPLEQFLLYNFVEPTIVASLMILIFMISSSKKKSFLNLMILINLVLYTFTFAGRINFFRLIIFLLLVVFLYRRKNKTKLVERKSRKKVFLIVLLTLIIGISITINRSDGALYSVVEQIYAYFVGSLVLFDTLSNLGYPAHSEYLFGRATIGGLVDSFILFFEQTINVFDFSKTDMAIMKINSVTSLYYVIGPGKVMNAFPTMFYVFKQDFGMIGVFVVPFIYSSILSYFKVMASKKFDIRYDMIYILLGFIGIFGSNRWEPTQFWVWGAAFFIMIFIKRPNLKKGKLYE